MNYNPQFIFKEPYIRKICNDKFVSNLSGNTKRINLNNLDGKRFPRSVQKFNRDITGLHPTQKPVLLFEYLIKTYTNEGNVILDNCSGSGTTDIASINTNRKYICIEKDKGYYDLSVNRINHRLEYGTDTYKKPKFK